MVQIKQGDIDEQIKKDSLEAGGSPYKPLTGSDSSPFTGINPTKDTVIRNPDDPSDYRMTPSFDNPVNKNTSDTQSARVGDYIFTKNGPVTANKSITDWVEKYATVVGGTKRKGLTFGDWMGAIGTGIGALLGVPTDSSNAGTLVGTTLMGQALKYTPLNGGYGLTQFANSLMNAQEKYNEEWANTLVDYSSAVKFVDDGKGGKKAVIDFNKVSQAGEDGSGKGVGISTDTSKTKVEFTDENKLTISASDAFINSSAYQDLIGTIKDKLSTFTKEQADEVVDQDTGKTRLQVLEQMVKDAESQYYYTARSIATLKSIAPTASNEALSKGSYTMLSGYVKSDNLKDMTISVYDENNNLSEVNAKEYFDKIKAMSKTERNDYMLSLGNRVNSTSISDDEKAILQAQSNALYAQSASDGEYKGIYAKDFWDTIGDTAGFITGIRLGDFAKPFGGYGELSTFTNDDIFSGFLGLGSRIGGMFTMGKIVNGLEGLLRSGVTKLGGAIGSNSVGNFLKNLNGFAPQDVGQSLGGAISEAAKGGFKEGAKAVGTWLGKTATQVGFQMGADMIYDGAKAAAYAITGNDYDFLSELKTDFLLDTMMTYGPAAYRNSMAGDGSKYELRQTEINKTRATELNKMTEGDEFKIQDYKAGDTEYQWVKVTAKEISQRRAEAVDKFTDSKAGQTVQKLFFDKNMAMNKLSVQVLAKTGDNFLFRKMLRASGDIKALTRWSENDFRRVYGESLRGLGEVMKQVAPKVKDFTKEDADYINAMGNRDRLIKKAGGDEKIIKKIHETYDPAIKGVSAERAAQLDQMRTAMAKVASDVLANYQRKGILDNKSAKRLAAYEGYYPVWSKDRAARGGEIRQERAKAKNIFDPSEIIALDELADPLVSLAGEIQNMARNIAINERALAIREAASVAGVGIHLYKDTGGGLKEVSNLRELNEKFERKYQKIQEITRQEFPDKKAWQEENDKIVLESKALKKHTELDNLQNEAKTLTNRLHKEQSAFKKLTGTSIAKTKFDFKKLDAYASVNIDKMGAANRQYLEALKADLIKKYGRNPTTPKGQKEFLRLESMGINDTGLIPGAEKYYVEPTAEEVAARANSDKKAFANDIAKIKEANSAAKKAFTGVKDAEEISKKIFDTKAEIEANRQAQELLLDEIKEEAAKTIKKALKASKAPMKLDVDSYVDIQLTNMLKKALKQNNAQGAIQAVLNEAVEKANPWVDPELVIQTRAEDAAEAFRKQVNKEIAFKKSANPSDADRINAVADRVSDYIVGKVMGKKGTKVTKVGDDDDPSRTYTTRGNKNQIKYRLDGEEYVMTLTGKGAEELVDEFYRPEANVPDTFGGKVKQRLGKAANNIAQAKRYLTTSADPSRVFPNLMRDWTRGIVSTGGMILLSPDMLRTEAIESGKLNEEQIRRVDQGWRLTADNIKGSTFTKSLEGPKKNKPKTMRAALTAPDGEGFVKYTFGKTLKETASDARTKNGGGAGEKFSILQDTAETFTRMRAMSNAYYNEIGKAVSEGKTIDEAIDRGMEAAYMYGVEATTNFSRRGELIEKFAKQVPYLSQKFATLESFKNVWLDDPIAVTRSLRTTVLTYASCIAILLSNEESRKKYFMLSEYDRANNILISLDNSHIITIPLDDVMAAFLTPYRRAIETLHGVDPEAFYMWGIEFLDALNPFDLSGFSEGDCFNIQRGFEKLGAQLIPTWAQPIVEMWTQRDLYYGSDISMTEEEVGEYYGIYNPTPGQMTTKSKNSKTLEFVSNLLGIPQWQLQNAFAEYGGNVGQYALSVIDKLAGATEEEQGGKDWLDAIFKPFTGNDSSNVSYTFNDGVNALQEKKKRVQAELKTINTQLKTAVGEDRENILNHRQEIINKYGTEVTDYLNQYLSAYEITGGLTTTQANKIWYLYVLYDDDGNSSMLSNIEDAGENYYYSKARTLTNKRATNLAAMSGLSKYVDGRTRDPANNYYETYGAQAFANTVYGSKMGYVNAFYNILEKNKGNEGQSFYDLREAAYANRSAAYNEGDYTKADSIAYDYDKKVLAAITKYIQNSGKDADDVINNSQVIDYLSDWILVPSSFMKTKKGKYVPALMSGAQKEKAFKKPFIKYLFGIEED